MELPKINPRLLTASIAALGMVAISVAICIVGHRVFNSAVLFVSLGVGLVCATASAALSLCRDAWEGE